ncbi:conserved hypothetical protein (putative transposase or invertase) [Pedobacter sp. ok626]|uniref:hypothetical protein n=1 Tax=Pedobacter sp. ok626 TaxID=1761882 RepID=UPI0008823ED1|nr:hypothetical protein [Pedobacter sp. ok626]SDL13944.1 conserved hypothetical protein (putative transposase or invertase) [Pedobacter sp. ok626]
MGDKESDDAVIPERKKYSKKKVAKRDDELWKGILEDVFGDFLRFFFPDADKLFDMSKKFVFLDKEFNRLFPPERNTAGVRFVDKLVKVHLKEGGSKFILVHVEIQGQGGHEDLRTRMFRYFYRAKDKHNVSITAFAILIDSDKKYHPKIYKEDYLGTKLSYEFNTYKLLDQNEQKLRADPNPFAIVALVALLALKNKNADDDHLKRIKIDLTKELIKRNVSKEKHIKIMDFLAYYVNFNKPEMMLKFEKEVEQLTGRTTAMGVREILLDRATDKGRVEGRNEGLNEGRSEGLLLGSHRATLKIALEMKKDGFPIDKIVKLTKLSVKEVEVL